MDKISKKAIYILAIVFGVICVVLILFWTLFGLSSVSVEYSSTLQNLTVSAEEIIEAGKFNYGASVLFESKDKYIQNIYDAACENENLAYIRITNIETVFPNKFVIHVVEREEIYAVETGDGYLVCDRDFRVLRIADSYTSSEGQAIILNGLEFSNESIQVGDFLDVEQVGMLNFYSALLQNNRDLSEITGKFSYMQLSSYVDELTGMEYDKLTLTTFSGRTFEVCNPDFALANKIALLFAVESSLYGCEVDQNGNLLNSGQIIYVTKNESGELLSASEEDEAAFALTYSVLSNCIIKVDNLTLDDNISRTESDIYYALVMS